ncbi:MAG TPA: DUF1127 domain-containing protein [Acetobacteraceae bacterium]|jgi:uncharacterized protein YjiS (DUF1127 family)
MTAQITKSQFLFELPSLSYVDAKWEEPNLTIPAARPAPRAGFRRWISGRINALTAARREAAAAAELEHMTDHELMDIGLTRADLPRVFEPAFNKDLAQRGGAA